MESGGFLRRVSRPAGRPPRRVKSGDAYALDSNNLFRLKLGKTETEFFSARGNNRLKRIWLENDLDDEMIFASWILPSKALMRQKVSDYLQAFLMKRTQCFPYYSSTEMFAIIRRLNDIRRSSGVSISEKDRHEYFNQFVKSTLENKYDRRQREENERVAKSVANEELPVMPGFEYIAKSPVFKAKKIEKEMKKLNQIPIPYNEEEFQVYVLPIMTALAISNERMNQNQSKTEAKSTFKNDTAASVLPSSSEMDLRSSSGFSDASAFHSSQRDDDDGEEEDDSDLIQVFSEMDLISEYNESLSDSLCDSCGGLENDDPNATMTSIHCSCLSDSMWAERNNQTAAALYKDASKIVNMYLREQAICSKYMEKWEPVNWMTSD